MSKNVFVSSEEMDKQRDIINTLRNNFDLEYQKTGNKKKMHIITYGCQQNVNDSEKIRGILDMIGYEHTEDKEMADIIIFNTCCVRENAELKVFGKIGALKKLKTEKPNIIIGICGCMVQQSHIVEEIEKKYKHVEMVFGTHNLYRLPELLFNIINNKKSQLEVFDIDGQIFEGVPVKRDSITRAWVSIMYGCNNFCSYCIVPYVRGRERSRKPQTILEEIKSLVRSGCIEITLLGQNVNSYGKDLDDNIDFADLLDMISQVEGLKRIRFMTSHPKDISDKLIETMARNKNISKHLHLPFQAGSNKILKLMNRRYTKEEYLEKINKVKSLMPDIALSTDVIVGFPGEDSGDFEETLDIIKKVEFDQIYMFIYSKRKGTPAEKYDDVIDMSDKKKNFGRLLGTQNDISKKKNLEYMGRTVEVLVEGLSKYNDNALTGRTDSNKVVNFAGDARLIDKLVNVKITEAHSWFLNGEIIP